MNLTKHTPDRTLPLKALRIGLIIALALSVLAVGAFAYVWFSGGAGQPSRAVTAPSLKLDGTARLFRIQSGQSEVRFVINETLLGQPKTVVGATREVAGALAVDFEHPAQSMAGEIRINVRTLRTDNEFRNRALRGPILGSSAPEFEFASFIPRKLVGLPERITFGEPFSFQIMGDLTVRGVTREVMFEATVTPASRDRIEGSAHATIRYSDFGIAIPEAPGVANVGETVRLEIDFAAVPTVES